MELSEHVHFCVGGWKCFTDVITTSWDTCSMTCASCRFSWEHLSTSWSFCIFTCLLVNTSSWVLRLAFFIFSGSTQEETLVTQAYFFSNFSCLPIKEVWECLSFSCSSSRALRSSILPMTYSSSSFWSMALAFLKFWGCCLYLTGLIDLSNQSDQFGQTITINWVSCCYGL
jgi:hypothetical protein